LAAHRRSHPSTVAASDGCAVRLSDEQRADERADEQRTDERTERGADERCADERTEGGTERVANCSSVDVGVEKVEQPSASTTATTAAEESILVGTETDEWDAGDATRDDIRPHSDGWYYTDVDDASVLHGPFALADVRGWLDDGECQRSDLMRHGRDGKDVALSTLVRVAEDGKHYTRAEFVEHFGGTDEWNAAPTQEHVP
jgi:hypothetical protein